MTHVFSFQAATFVNAETNVLSFQRFLYSSCSLLSSVGATEPTLLLAILLTNMSLSTA